MTSRKLFSIKFRILVWGGNYWLKIEIVLFLSSLNILFITDDGIYDNIWLVTIMFASNRLTYQKPGKPVDLLQSHTLNNYSPYPL